LLRAYDVSLQKVKLLVLSFEDITALVEATSTAVALEMTVTPARLSADFERLRSVSDLCLSHAPDCVRISTHDAAFEAMKARLSREYWDRFCEATFRGGDHVASFIRSLQSSRNHAHAGLQDFVRSMRNYDPRYVTWASDWLLRLSAAKLGATIIVEGVAVVAIFAAGITVAAPLLAAAFVYSVTCEVVQWDFSGTIDAIALSWNTSSVTPVSENATAEFGPSKTAIEIGKEGLSHAAEKAIEKLTDVSLAAIEKSVPTLRTLYQKLSTVIEGQFVHGVIDLDKMITAGEVAKVLKTTNRSLKFVKVGSSFLPIVFTALDIYNDATDAYDAYKTKLSVQSR
jgi:hypothetical protein